MVANATSVAACALLGAPHRGLFRADLVQRMREVMDLLRLQDVRMTPALVADEGEFSDSIASLLRDQIVATSPDPRGEILYFEESRRRALDVYRNVLLHFLFAPSLMARRLLRGASVAELREELAFWLEFFYSEFFAPRGLVLAAHFDAFLDYFERIGVLERPGDDRLEVTEKGRSYFAFLGEQTRSMLESYYVTFSAVLSAEDGVTLRQLEQAAKEHFERTRLLGEVQRREAWNPVTCRNAVELLVHRGVLAMDGAGEGRRERGLRRGPAEAELPALHERLAATLRAG
jgi:glycerol-3-phosphate O-acyltransferase